MSKKLLKTQNLVEKYQVSPATIYRWRQQGMPFKQIGRSIRFDEVEVDEWIENCKSKQ